MALGGLGWTTAQPKASADRLRLAEVDIMDYGAAGDGITNDTAAIHSARDAAGVGGKVVIPSGTYLVSGLEADVENQQWVLSDGAVLMMKTGAPNILKIVGDGVTVEGGVFDGSTGTSTDWSQQGIRVEADGVTIRNVEVRDSPMNGVYGVNSNGLTVTSCRIIDHYGGGVFVLNGDQSMVSDIVITGNYVESSNAEANGIGVLGGFSDDYTRPVQRIKISRNTVILPIHVPGTQPTAAIGIIQARDWIISDNYCEGTELGISNGAVTRAVISNNVVRKYSALGIEISGPVSNCTISGNIIDGTEAPVYGAGILNSTGTIDGLSIVGNTISGFTGQITGVAFGNETVVESATIADNVIRADCNKFTGVSFSGATSNVTISGNTFDAATITNSVRGIEFLKSATNCAIVGNTFRSETSGDDNYPVSFGSGTASGINVTGNTFSAGVSAGFAPMSSFATTNNVTFTGNSVNGGTSTFSSGIELWSAVNGLTVSGNKFMNLTEAVVRLAASTAVTLQNIMVAGNNIVNVPKQFSDVTSGGAVVATTVTSADQPQVSPPR